MKTTLETLATNQVEMLMHEAGEAGDTLMHEDCAAVLHDWHLATRIRSRHQDRLARIIGAINDAEGMQ